MPCSYFLENMSFALLLIILVSWKVSCKPKGLYLEEPKKTLGLIGKNIFKTAQMQNGNCINFSGPFDSIQGFPGRPFHIYT